MTGQEPQLSLPWDRPPMARRSDANSSHAAADRAEKSGSAEDQRQVVLLALRRFPGSTSKELAKLADLDRHMVGRRLPELADERRWGGRTPVRRVESGSDQLRWFPR